MMKSFFTVLSAAILLPCVALIIFVMVATWRIPIHNGNLRQFERSFRTIVHPTDSGTLSRYAHFGLFGNSNHCDYFVGELRSSRLPRAEIEQHYRGMVIHPPDTKLGVWDGDPPTQSELEVYFSDAGIWGSWPWSEWLQDDLHFFSDNEKTVYLVFAEEDGYPPIGDFRCH